MNNLIKISAVALLLSGTSVWAAEKVVKLSVPDMSCVSCPYVVKKSISKVDGVLSVSATMKDRSATVAFDDTKTNVDQVRAATASIGYPSTVVPSTGG
tara:strand:- start:337 stop:630 length:294 start_codon:yes stop_codon:yes gene_type:complete